MTFPTEVLEEIEFLAVLNKGPGNALRRVLQVKVIRTHQTIGVIGLAHNLAIGDLSGMLHTVLLSVVQVEPLETHTAFIGAFDHQTVVDDGLHHFDHQVWIGQALLLGQIRVGSRRTSIAALSIEKRVLALDETRLDLLGGRAKGKFPKIGL